VNILLGGLVGAFCSLIITLIFNEPFKKAFAFIIMKFGPLNNSGISGIWVAKFYYKDANGVNPFTEIIELKESFGIVFGRIIPDNSNYEKIKPYTAKKPLRVRGELVDNRYFTGYWFHPIERNRCHGAFQLLVNIKGNKLTGTWIGFSESQNRVNSGDWVWERVVV